MQRWASEPGLLPLGFSIMLSPLSPSSSSSYLCCLQEKTQRTHSRSSWKTGWIRTKVLPSEEQQNSTERQLVTQLLEEAEFKVSRLKATHILGLWTVIITSIYWLPTMCQHYVNPLYPLSHSVLTTALWDKVLLSLFYRMMKLRFREVK